MPEGPEVRIMSDFINEVTKDKNFIKSYHVSKGNNSKEFDVSETSFNEFEISSDFYGKKVILNLKSMNKTIPIFIFMGMSGSWKFVETEIWNQTKYVRLRFDTDDGYSLLLYGGYLGPKYSINQNFKSSKNGPDPIKEFDKFKNNILSNLDSKLFRYPIYEVLLDQYYFAGVGNYLRSTILYYADISPFISAKQSIIQNPNLIEICRQTMIDSYEKNGGQLKDWTNPFNEESQSFKDWVYYQKGCSVKDSKGRTFWYNPKWDA